MQIYTNDNITFFSPDVTREFGENYYVPGVGLTVVMPLSCPPDEFERRICEDCGANIVNDGAECFYCETYHNAGPAGTRATEA